mmetsp:Transcript_37298/g.100962  ORF Transcript_37298/g.100962 Transcript_37298/m.100962 type:complete len:220 (-) Transcript_37298:284-943(-)
MVVDFYISSCKMTGALPTEIGNMVKISTGFSVIKNDFCEDLPTEVAVLSSQVTDWTVTTGNQFGTACCVTLPSQYPTCAPSMLPTVTPQPTVSFEPSAAPSAAPTFEPTKGPPPFTLSGEQIVGIAIGSVIVLAALFLVGKHYLCPGWKMCGSSKHHFDPRRKSERNPDGTRVTSNLNKTPKGGKGLSGFAGAVEFKDNPMSDQSGKDVGEIDARTNYA